MNKKHDCTHLIKLYAFLGLVILCLLTVHGETIVSSVSLDEDHLLEDAAVVKKSGNTISFSAKTAKESSWFIVRFHSNTSVHIDDSYLKKYSNFTHSDVTLDACNFILTNLEVIVRQFPFAIGWRQDDDWYIQMDVGPINFTRNNLADHQVGARIEIFDMFNDLVLPPGDWYIIFYSTPVPSMIEMMIDLSSEGNVTFYEPTYGTSSVQFESKNFHGKLIVTGRKKMRIPGALLGISRGLGIAVDAQRTFQVNHTFIGQFFDLGGELFDHTRLTFSTPQGELSMKQTSVNRRRIRYAGDFDFWDVFVGTPGEYKITGHQYGKWNLPMLFFIGADVVLPDAPRIKSQGVQVIKHPTIDETYDHQSVVAGVAHKHYSDLLWYTPFSSLSLQTDRAEHKFNIN